MQSDTDTPSTGEGTPLPVKYDSGGNSSWGVTAITDFPSILGIVYPAYTYDPGTSLQSDEPVIIPFKPKADEEK